jgi:hypothetical protein
VAKKTMTKGNRNTKLPQPRSSVKPRKMKMTTAIPREITTPNSVKTRLGTLKFFDGMPAKNFWSIVIYDNQTRSMLQTDAQFRSIVSQKEGIEINPDTCLDVYFGPKPPAGKENNWVQTVPGKRWNAVLRLYGPEEAWFDKTWRPGEIELVK